MILAPLETQPIRYYEQLTIEEVLLDCLPILAENSVLAIAPNLVALCEGSFTYKETARVKRVSTELDIGQLDIYEPSDPQYSADRIRRFFANLYDIKKLGVVIVGEPPLAHSGIKLIGNKKQTAARLLSELSLAMKPGVYVSLAVLIVPGLFK